MRVVQAKRGKQLRETTSLEQSGPVTPRITTTTAAAMEIHQTGRLGIIISGTSFYQHAYDHLQTRV